MSSRINEEIFGKVYKLIIRFGTENGLDMVDPTKDDAGIMEWDRVLSFIKLLHNNLQAAYKEIDSMKAPAPQKSTTTRMIEEL